MQIQCSHQSRSRNSRDNGGDFPIPNTNQPTSNPTPFTFYWDEQDDDEPKKDDDITPTQSPQSPPKSATQSPTPNDNDIPVGDDDEGDGEEDDDGNMTFSVSPSYSVFMRRDY